jgi:hypothetical protein
MCEEPHHVFPFPSVGEREVSKVILGYLDQDDLLNARSVNKTWMEFVTKQVWPTQWVPVELFPAKVTPSSHPFSYFPVECSQTNTLESHHRVGFSVPQQIPEELAILRPSRQHSYQSFYCTMSAAGVCIFLHY